MIIIFYTIIGVEDSKLIIYSPGKGESDKIFHMIGVVETRRLS
jgi:hypothetical protein